ncbi:MAG: DUF2939 domain-containing protein [Pseudomonadota bacterium]
MKRAIILFVILGLGYLAWPYVAIAQLGNAVKEGNVSTLEKRVAWEDVRGHLKNDLAEQMSAGLQEQATNSGSTLGGLLTAVLAPAVSESVIDGLVDATVTPEVVAELAKERGSDQAEDSTDAQNEEMLKDPLKHVQWAFFSGLTTFEARVRPDRGEPATQFNFELQGLNWKLVRVIPPENFSLQAG